MQWLTIATNLATSLGFFLLAWQLWLTRKALQTQIRANEVQTYMSLNSEFLEIISSFSSDINNPNLRENDLTDDERRAIDRYFYLANMEFILYKQGVVDDRLASQWIRGWKSVAKKTVFVDRWKSTALNFSLDEEFKKFFEQQIRNN